MLCHYKKILKLCNVNNNYINNDNLVGLVNQHTHMINKNNNIPISYV